MEYDWIITSHTNPDLSGVARFNHVLAAGLGIPCIDIVDAHRLSDGHALLSLKMRDEPETRTRLVEALIDGASMKSLSFDVFFHTFDGLLVEYILTERCGWVLCGNAEIEDSIRGLQVKTAVLWCPGLLTGRSLPIDSQLKLFSFGMAHKLQVRYFLKLWEMLEQFGVDYRIYVSTSFHEKASLGDFKQVSTELQRIFSGRIHFLGFLSDELVSFFLDRADLFVAFFEHGYRANNTSVNAALERGCAVLTNLDGFSPSWAQHGSTILGIADLKAPDLGGENLRAIGHAAAARMREHASWQLLYQKLQALGEVANR